MLNLDYKQLIYNRQYILSNQEINCSFKYKTVNLISSYRLFYHEKLVYNEASSSTRRIILLGDIYNYLHPEDSNQNILEVLLSLNLAEILLATAKFAGRFVIIIQDQKNINIFHDTSACRKIYYATINGSAICSSSQHLLARALGFEATKVPSKLSYYKSDDLELNHFSNILESTYYDEIKQLLPNHHLNVSSCDVSRYWPHETLPHLSKEECVEECATMIKGFLVAASNRYQLMMPVTAGYDSRILLAASQDIKDKIFYYLNDIEAVRKSADKSIPQKLLSKYNLKLNLLSVPDNVDEKFREVYLGNNIFANQEMIETVFNYLIHHPDKLNLPGGTIPIIKSMYHSNSKKIDGSVLAGLHGYDKYDYAVNEYDHWLEGLNGVCERTNINMYDLLYWEDRTPNWGTEIQLDKDIAQEEFVVFNSAYLVSRMLTYDITQRKQPHYKLHKDLVKTLGPELLEEPFNPSITNSIKQLLLKIRLYTPVMKLKKLLFK